MQTIPTVYEIVFTLFSFICGYTFVLYRKSIDLFEDALQSIYDEIEDQLIQLTTIRRGKTIEDKQLQDSIIRIRKLHFCSIVDFMSLYKINKMAVIICIIALTALVIAIASTAIPALFSYFSKWNYELINAIPFLIFVVEVGLLIKMLMIENKLKKLRRKYRFREY